MNLLIAKVFNFFNFNDAAQAVKEGVFSETSVGGYSINRSLVLYVGFIALSIVVSFLVSKIFKKFFANNIAQIREEKPLTFFRLQNKEYIFLGLFMVVVAVSNLFLHEKTLNYETIHSEDFYNLAALNEIRQAAFSIIYPYSVGHLLIASILKNLGIQLIYYKIFLNFIAIFFVYSCLSLFISRISYRIGTFIGIASLFFLSIVSPSLHENILRFFMPVISTLLLFHFVNYFSAQFWNKTLGLSAVFSAVLFFGSADNIAIFLVVYFLFSIYQIIINKNLRDRLVFIIVPIFGLLVQFIIFGVNYKNLITNQLLSIVFYSGHPNSVPYLNLFYFLHSQSIGSFFKNFTYTLIFYLPFLLFASIIFYYFSIWETKTQRYREPFIILIILFIAYFLYYRQNFGNAASGRIITTSTILMFLLLVIKKYFSPNIINKTIFYIAVIFFFTVFLVNTYFLRYSLLYFYDANQVVQNTGNTVLCSETFLKNEMAFIGFNYCDRSLVADLEQIKIRINSQPFYVYDDTFSLYYLLSGRPIVLITSYYMSYTKEAVLVEKMQARQVKNMIYPRQNHFFGVPEESLKNPNFMKIINNYRDDNFNKTLISPHFEVYGSN